ncbi:nuclear transport factor 2 family protein [Millisia brevis]|uniref:nuclear transport factor 2 family protein n=1 Tax=Millisia brevis TaxID=264148 RepID=UPI00083071EA|nr:nuclear transport factor 2 family protein [Millisia brevis]
MHPFRKAVEARDLDAVADLLDDDVVFTSPVAFQPYPGKPITVAILRNVIEVLEGFHYVREIGAPDAADHALVFEATIDGKAVTGCDFIHVNDAGLIDDFVVMVRPLSATKALAEQMNLRYERIKQQAGF